MSELGRGAADARALAISSCERLTAALDRLDDVLEQSSGVPIQAISDDDSLAVSMDTSKEESIMQTQRSRRALSLAGRR